MPFDKSTPLDVHQFLEESNSFSGTKTEPTGFADKKSNDKIKQPLPTTIPAHIDAAHQQTLNQVAKAAITQLFKK